MAETELWLPVPGFPGYEVSNLGSVRSVDLEIVYLCGTQERRRVRKGRVLKGISHDGYLMLNLSVKGKIRQIGVHRAVALAFLGPCPQGWNVDHLNTIKTDNRAENLEFVTTAENTRRQHQNGMIRYFSANDARNLSESQIAEIVGATGTTSRKELAEKYGVSERRITAVRAKAKKMGGLV